MHREALKVALLRHEHGPKTFAKTLKSLLNRRLLIENLGSDQDGLNTAHLIFRRLNFSRACP